jgi:hypothetical protein
MLLTEIERDVTKAVAKNYMVNKEATTHEQLLRRFRDPRPIIKLVNAHIFTADNNNTNRRYLPTILAFHNCGDENLLQTARSAVEVVIRDLKRLFATNYEQSRRYEPAALLSELPDYVPVADQIALGLFLVRDMPNTIHGQLNEGNTNVTSFQINEHILTQDPERVWNEYVRMYSPAESAIAQDVAQPPTPSPPLRKGSDWLPSRWKMQGSLGEGGQGWTYKVRRSSGPDRGLYVLKRLKNKERLLRFQNEIAALTKLQHPGILKIVETSEELETPFFVTEYCEGSDLGKANLSGKPLLDRLRIFRQVCDAVAAAHSANILHRDLKPPNIFLRKDDSVVVGDFGLCIDLDDAKERATQSLEGVGAERYIAPEVAKGRVSQPQPSSDLYSLGKVLYFILSGRTLLREEYAEAEDDLRTQNEGPAMHFVYELFDKTITGRPQDRFQSAVDLLRELDRVIQRVQLNAHLLKLSIRQNCMFCVVGEYRPTMGPGSNEMMLVCQNCGNIQKFRSAPPASGWWEEK